MDESADYEEEETLALVELSGIIDNGFLQTCGTKCKLLNVETERPVLQLGHYVFKGRYENIAGTAIIFEVVTDSPRTFGASNEYGLSSGSKSRDTGAIKSLNYYDITRKKLNMTRAFLSEKNPSQCESAVGKKQ